jgi:hypothetical protein
MRLVPLPRREGLGEGFVFLEGFAVRPVSNQKNAPTPPVHGPDPSADLGATGFISTPRPAPDLHFEGTTDFLRV